MQRVASIVASLLIAAVIVGAHGRVLRTDDAPVVAPSSLAEWLLSDDAMSVFLAPDSLASRAATVAFVTRMSDELLQKTDAFDEGAGVVGRLLHSLSLSPRQQRAVTACR